MVKRFTVQKKGFLTEEFPKQTLDLSAFLTSSGKYEVLGGFFAPPTALSTVPQKELVFLGPFGSSSWTLRRSDTYLKSSH